VLLSQQPQYTIIATTVALQVKHQPTFYYPHTRAEEKEIQQKRTRERGNENYLKTGRSMQGTMVTMITAVMIMSEEVTGISISISVPPLSSFVCSAVLH